MRSPSLAGSRCTPRPRSARAHERSHEKGQREGEDASPSGPREEAQARKRTAREAQEGTRPVSVALTFQITFPAWMAEAIKRKAMRFDLSFAQTVRMIVGLHVEYDTETHRENPGDNHHDNPGANLGQDNDDNPKNVTFRLQPPPLPSPDPSPYPIDSLFFNDEATNKSIDYHPPIVPPPASRFEIAWRVETVWAAHLKQFRRFHKDLDGAFPGGREPTLTKEIREDIQRALREYDADLLTAETRDQWVAESKARAAGIGMYFDPWFTGRDSGSNGRRYLEHWRPWRRQRGKAEPVEHFAELYFQQKQAEQQVSNGPYGTLFVP